MNKFTKLKGYRYFLFSFFLPLFFCGCEKETIGDKEDGEINLDLDLSANPALNIVTRASYIDSLFTLPDPSDFKIQLFNATNELLKEWETYSVLPHPIKVQATKFRIKASYGDPEKSGFDCPSFSGDTLIQVRGAKEKRVALTTSFAKVLASVHYREGLKNQYKDYNTLIISAHDTVTFGKEEKRTAFFPVGNLQVVLNLTKDDTTRRTIVATTLTHTKAAEYYRFHIDIEGEQGYEKLLISFDSTTTATPIEIELSQDWQAHKKPYLTPAFDTTAEHSYLLGASCKEGTFYTLITAIGKIGSCKIQTSSQELIAKGWPAEVDLLNLTGANQSRLEKLGLKWSKNMANANMAELDFSGIVANLPAGDQMLTVQVGDIYGQLSQILPIRFSIIPPEFRLIQPEEPAIARSLEYAFKVRMNGGNPNKIRIEYFNEYPAFGVAEWTDCPITSYLWNETKDEVTVATKVNINKSALQFRAKYDETITEEVTVRAINPTFQIQTKEGWTWHNRAKLNIEQTDGSNGLAQNTLTEQYLIQISTDQNIWLSASHEGIKFDKTNNLVKFQLNNLNADQSYYVRVAFDAKMDLGICYSDPVKITTEKITELPAMNLTSTASKSINKGGGYGYTAGINSKHQDKNTIYYYEGVSPWFTVNSKTMPNVAKTENTWYIISSTLPQNSGYLLRNVGWDDQGDTPDPRYGKYAWEATNLSDLTPPEIKHYSAGKLFLSSGYGYNHSTGIENYNEGIEFTSRPSTLQFSYTYNNKGFINDKALVRIIIEAADGTVIGEGEATYGNEENLTQTSLDITYTVEDKKAAKLKIMFASSNSCSNNQSEEESRIKNLTTDNKGEAIRTGSEFYIENVSLTYK